VPHRLFLPFAVAMDLLQLLQAPESVCRPHSRFLFFIRLVTAFLMIFLSSLYLSLDQETTSSGAESVSHHPVRTNADTAMSQSPSHVLAGMWRL
jgi:hypothetical protein